MFPAIIGITTGFLAILLINVLGKSNKAIMYGLVLTGIGFLYVGFTWTEFNQLVVSIVQAFVFLLFAYFGLTKSIHIIVIGYFLHGIWDLLYGYFTTVHIIPPHYDIFCLTVDVTMGIYILMFKKRFATVA